MSRNIFVCASDLAVVTGHNPYKDKAEIFYKYWKKHFKDNYAETLEILKNKNLKNLKEETHMQCLERISQENNINVGAIKNKVFACLRSKNVEQLSQDKAKIDSVIKQLPKAQQKEFADSFNHITNTQFGIRNENLGVDIYQQKMKCEVELTRKYFKKELFHIENDGEIDVWTLGGKVDGIATIPIQDNSKSKNKTNSKTNNSKKVILEIKNRVNRLFNEVRDYEKVQCYAYMYVLDLDEVHLAEIMKSSQDHKMNIFPIVFEEDFWENQIMKSIETFVNEFYEFLENTPMKIHLMSHK